MRYFILSLLFMSCAASDHIVESDYSYRAQFHRYKTFDFAAIDGFDGSPEEVELIEKYIGTILTSWGYRRNTKKPDLYIYYSVFLEELQMQGYNQKELQNWSGLSKWYRMQIENKDSLGRSVRNIATSEKETVSDEDEYKPFRRQLNEGTLYISFYDRRKKTNVWQGYASGYFGKDGIPSERVLRSAIISILDEFRLPSISS